jgi:hypothetical protein
MEIIKKIERKSFNIDSILNDQKPSKHANNLRKGNYFYLILKKIINFFFNNQSRF